MNYKKGINIIIYYGYYNYYIIIINHNYYGYGYFS